MVFTVEKLNNGVEIPVLGLGVYLTDDYGEMKDTVKWAIEKGYTSFDTAQMYKNEHLLGNAIKDLKLNRDKLFITSKVDIKNMGYENTLKSFEESREKLQASYIDMFLVHWPGQKKERLIETYKAMEDLYKQGKIRVIGVCNCEPKHLNWILEECETVPAINQVERHPFFNDKKLFDWCNQRNIRLEAWAPLNRGNFDNPRIKKIAEKYNRTPAQIILRWDIQSGYIVIPKSVHKERIFENANIFDFELREEDIENLNNMNTGARTSFDPATFDF